MVTILTVASSAVNRILTARSIDALFDRKPTALSQAQLLNAQNVTLAALATDFGTVNGGFREGTTASSVRKQSYSKW